MAVTRMPNNHATTKVQIETAKVVLAIVELYKSKDEKSKLLAIDLAGNILETYSEKEQMRMDILGSYVSGSILAGRISSMKRSYPDESKILSEIFGIFLFGAAI